MEEKSARCSLIGILCGSVILASGLFLCGKASLKEYLTDKNLVEVQGLSERIVKSDIAVVRISLEYRDTDQKRFIAKHTTDKNKLMNCLKKSGITKDDIISDSFDVWEDYGKVRSFSGRDTIEIKTADFEKVEAFRKSINQLCSEQQIMCAFNVSYMITNFLPLKMSMLEEASQNARKSAEAAIKTYGNHITSLAHLHQGTVVITGESSSATESYDNSKSINKKVRLVVRAGFRYK